MTIKVNVELSNNNQKIQPSTLWREGAIYTPIPRPGFPKLPPPNSLTAYSQPVSGVKLQGERFTNPTFSRTRDVYKSELTYSCFTHMSSADEGFNNLRVPPGVWVMKVPSTISRTPPFPVAGSSPEGLDLRVYASG